MPTALRRTVPLVQRLLICVFLLATPLLYAGEESGEDKLDQCLLDAMRRANPETTVTDLHKECEAQNTNLSESDRPPPVQRRYESEYALTKKRWAITPHRPNYLLPATIMEQIHDEPFVAAGDADASQFQRTEIQFQISLKFAVAPNLFGNRAMLFGSYTNRSFWQAYNSDLSSPFRETNHEPEVFLAIPRTERTFGLQNSLITVGVNHQSNGRSDPLSRSWNRIFAAFIFENKNWVFSLKPWLRVPESRANDDNPNIEKFLGYGEFRGFYAREKSGFGVMLRNNLRSDNRGAVELTWSRELSSKLRLFVYYFNGYGESLIDYDRRVQRLGIGVALNDWL